ncbi:MAG: arginine deiminase-related protein [Saprospiraceae bacterium]
MAKQISNTILMIRPAHFGYNQETATSNKFQKKQEKQDQKDIKLKACEEFDQMVAALKLEGVNVLVFEDSDEVVKPDAVFPNNWISMHEDGTLITYPMFAPVRRKERSENIIESLIRDFDVKKRLSLELFESKDQFLEGTGSIIFDHEHKLAYACQSVRTSMEVLQKLCLIINYRPVLFNAYDAGGFPIYHTNVLMALGKDFVVICMDAVEQGSRIRLKDQFEKTGKDVVDISFSQMESFAGNMLQVEKADHNPLLVMSKSAYDSLNAKQLTALESKTDILQVAIPTIELIGGGSARCMMAEVFLPPRVAV